MWCLHFIIYGMTNKIMQITCKEIYCLISQVNIHTNVSQDQMLGYELDLP